MRKNKVLTTAAVLLYLCLITFYLLSGIFARFIVSSKNSDVSRTAKYGVVITTSGNVMNSDTELVPGLPESDGMVFSLSGKPETAVSISCKLTGTDVCLPKGYYHADFGKSSIQFIEEKDHESITIENPDHYRFCYHAENDYYPIKFNIYHRSGEADVWTAVPNGQNISFESVAVWFENSFNRTWQVNDDLSALGEWKITVAWPQLNFEDVSGDQSYMDTLLCASQRIIWVDGEGNPLSPPEGFANGEKIDFAFEIKQLD